ncbi:MAG: aldolase/citrate lyase family protein [Chloroflexi bacterium]|nr:aldolase/citrate lyase family protein [Chloroflexota bacterium]
MKPNRIVTALKEGRKASGCILMFPSTDLVDLAGIAGFEFIHLDGEHGSFSPESLDAMCRAAEAAGLSVTARTPGLDPAIINLYLDRGVQGIIGPHIETAEEAKALVDACRFGPDGDRSWGGGRATFYNDPASIKDEHGSRLHIMKQANDNMLVIAQLETIKGFSNIESILKVKGIDGFTHGPNDLAQSMGLPGQPEHPTVIEAIGDANRRIHAGGGKMWGDLTDTTYAHQLFLSASRVFLKNLKQEAKGKMGGY